MNLQTLKTELADATYTDKSDVECADMLNARTVQVSRDTLDAGELVASIVRSEYASLDAGEKDFLRLVAMAGTLPLTSTLKQELGSIFPTGSTTRANWLKLTKRTGSRAEELGLGRVTSSDVADARRL